MEFILANLSITNGARFVDYPDLDASGVQKKDINNNLLWIKKLIITCYITSKIKDFPYAGKFEQVDYSVDIELPQDILPSQIELQLPVLVQNWITNKYPTINTNYNQV